MFKYGAFYIILPFTLSTLQCFSYSLSGYNNLQNTTRVRRQAETCGQFEFHCKSGECISDELYCDGKEDCKDGSDETDDCKSVRCQSYLFRCSYGACINGEKECDGHQDCKDNSDEMSPKCVKTETDCGTDAFKCKSGECIKGIDFCDGKTDCNDGSDETEEACGNFKCYNFAYRCAYGGCVNGDARCNNIRECVDGSDEKDCGPSPPVTPATLTPTPTPPVVTIGCKLPNFPENGKYNVSGLATFNTGNTVQSFTVIIFSCKSGYRVYPYENNPLICLSTTWNKNIPQCRPTCSSVSSTESVKVTCQIEDKSGEQYCENPVESTVARFSCQTYYEKANENDPPVYITRCRDGRWDKPPFECVPVCGKRRGKGQPNIIGGTEAQEHDFPWHTAIYNKTKSYLCGGSLIYYAERPIIVTAAHCIADYQRGNQLPKDNYLVALGKHYRRYDDERDRDSVQFPQIKNIHKYGKYRGELSQHAGDIALIELKDHVQITAFVQPVCMRWDYRKEYTSKNGSVIGWGYTEESGKLSDSLKVLDVPIISNQECFDTVREIFKPYVTLDKVCAGYQGRGQSVCSGDSGGGLVIREGSKYYLRGIVSVSPPSLSAGYCDQDSYAGYTDLQDSQYIEFLQTV